MFRNARLKLEGHLDNARGVDMCEARLVERLGPEPWIDPKDEKHAQMLRDLSNKTAIQRLEEEIKTRQLECAGSASPFVLSVVLIFLYAVETRACILLGQSFGWQQPERILFGLMLSAGVFVLTCVAARLGSIPSGGDVAAIKRRRVWFYVLLGAYGVFVGAVAAVRVDEMSVDTALPDADWAAAIIMIIICIGPAWAAELALAKIAPATKKRKEIAMLKQKLAALRRSYEQARCAIEEICAKQRRWREAAARFRATYKIGHDATAAGTRK